VLLARLESNTRKSLLWGTHQEAEWAEDASMNTPAVKKLVFKLATTQALLLVVAFVAAAVAGGFFDGPG
jgi:hypothetical protein